MCGSSKAASKHFLCSMLRLVHAIFVDEAQDFSPAELTALMSLCGSYNGITIAGDTCQTINPGSAFSFQDIVDAFKRLELKGFTALEADDVSKQAPDTHHPEDCGQMSLGFNYRSAPSIVRLANAVSELLLQMFPHTVDAVEETAAEATAAKPPLFVHLPDDGTLVDVASRRS